MAKYESQRASLVAYKVEVASITLEQTQDLIVRSPQCPAMAGVLYPGRKTLDSDIWDGYI